MAGWRFAVGGWQPRHRLSPSKCSSEGVLMWDGFVQDLRYAGRTLRRDPGFALFAVLILALGIGANTAVFSIAEPLVLRALPVREPERLVWIANKGKSEGLSAVTSR